MTMNDVYEVITWWAEELERAAVIRHYVLNGGTGVADNTITVAQALASALYLNWEDVTEDLMPTSATQICCSARRISPDGGMAQHHFGTAAGGLSSDCASAQVAVLVSLYTETFTGSGRGRMYIPFIAENVLSSGRLEATVATAALASIAPMFANPYSVGGGEYTFAPVIWSRKNSNYSNIITAIVRPVTVTQRRRTDPLQTYYTASP